MVEYGCDGCDKKFDHKSAYDRHRKKKIPCKVPDVKPLIVQDKLINIQTTADISNSLSKICNALLNQPVNIINNEIINHKCNHCNNSYSKACHLTRHYKTCSQKKQSEQKFESEINILKQKFELEIITSKQKIELEMINSKQQIELLNKELEIKNKENEYLRTLVSDAGNIIKTSVNATSYIMTNFTTTPALLAITDKSIITKNDETFVNQLIYKYNCDNLETHIGDIIIAHYKKTDPKNQPFWNTDVPRLTYIVRMLTDDKEDWFIDKRGTRIKAKIIDPLLNTYIRPELLEYLTAQQANMGTVKNTNEMENIFESMKTANLIIKLIDESKLANDIIRYIASFFYFQKNNEIKQIK